MRASRSLSAPREGTLRADLRDCYFGLRRIIVGWQHSDRRAPLFPQAGRLPPRSPADPQHLRRPAQDLLHLAQAGLFAPTRGSQDVRCVGSPSYRRRKLRCALRWESAKTLSLSLKKKKTGSAPSSSLSCCSPRGLSSRPSSAAARPPLASRPRPPMRRRRSRSNKRRSPRTRLPSPTSRPLRAGSSSARRSKSIHQPRRSTEKRGQREGWSEERIETCYLKQSASHKRLKFPSSATGSGPMRWKASRNGKENLSIWRSGG